MTALELILAPDPIFKTKAAKVEVVDDEVRKLMDDLLDTIYEAGAIGIAAPMVGVLKRVVVIDLQIGGEKKPLFMANPEIVYYSKEVDTVVEGSICFPGISAEVTRPASIKLEYLDYHNQSQTLEASGMLSTCIQHEVDYLNGKVFLDHLSSMKRDMLTRKMLKYIKAGHHLHQHDEFCNH